MSDLDRGEFANEALEKARRIIAQSKGEFVESPLAEESEKPESSTSEESKKPTTAELIDEQILTGKHQNQPTINSENFKPLEEAKRAVALSKGEIVEDSEPERESLSKSLDERVQDSYEEPTPTPEKHFTPERKVIGKNYTIFNNQIVEVAISPGNAVIAEPGAMCYMSSNIEFKTRAGDGANESEGIFSKVYKAGKRTLLGENFMLGHFTNKSDQSGYAAFSFPHFGEVRALNLDDVGEVTCQKKAFLCATKGVSLDITFSKKISTGFFGGEGFILEKLSGKGTAFIYAGGSLVEKRLNNEKLMVDTGSIVGFSNGIKFGIVGVGGLRNLAFGGEGLFLSVLEGTGTVWLQSAPFSRMAEMVLDELPPEKDKK